MQVLDAQKMEAKRIRNENAKLLKEKANIEKLEKQLESQKKRSEQAERRHELDVCVRAKLLNEKRRMEEELAFDMQCLQESLVSFESEDAERAARRQELRAEEREYRRYLEGVREEEGRQARELAAAVGEETEAQARRQLAKWRAQAAERRRLLEATLAGRRRQIEERGEAAFFALESESLK